MVGAAAGLVAIVVHAADHDERIVCRGRSAADHALGAGRLGPADGADGGQLGDLVRQRQQRGHGIEGSAEEVLVESADEHRATFGREQLSDLGQPVVEELGLVDGHHRGAFER